MGYEYPSSSSSSSPFMAQPKGKGGGGVDNVNQIQQKVAAASSKEEENFEYIQHEHHSRFTSPEPKGYSSGEESAHHHHPNEHNEELREERRDENANLNRYQPSQNVEYLAAAASSVADSDTEEYTDDDDEYYIDSDSDEDDNIILRSDIHDLNNNNENNVVHTNAQQLLMIQHQLVEEAKKKSELRRIQLHQEQYRKRKLQRQFMREGGGMIMVDDMGNHNNNIGWSNMIHNNNGGDVMPRIMPPIAEGEEFNELEYERKRQSCRMKMIMRNGIDPLNSNSNNLGYQQMGHFPADAIDDGSAESVMRMMNTTSNEFETIRRYIPHGSFLRLLTWLYEERKLLLFCVMHMACVLIIFAHHAVIKYNELKHSNDNHSKIIMPTFLNASIHITLFQIAILPLTMCKFSITTSLSSGKGSSSLSTPAAILNLISKLIPLDLMDVFHVYIGYSMVVIMCLTCLVYIGYFGIHCGMGEGSSCDMLTSKEMITGSVLSLLLLTLGISFHTRRSKTEQGKSDAFYIIHHLVVFLLYVIIASLAFSSHTEHNRPQEEKTTQFYPWWLFTVPLLCYMVDGTCMHFKSRYSTSELVHPTCAIVVSTKLHNHDLHDHQKKKRRKKKKKENSSTISLAPATTSTPIPELETSITKRKMVLLRLRRPKKFQYSCGQSVSIRIPKIDPFRWHSFPLGSNPESSILEFYIEVEDDDDEEEEENGSEEKEEELSWTCKLYHLIKSKSICDDEHDTFDTESNNTNTMPIYNNTMNHPNNRRRRRRRRPGNNNANTMNDQSLLLPPRYYQRQNTNYKKKTYNLRESENFTIELKGPYGAGIDGGGGSKMTKYSHILAVGNEMGVVPMLSLLKSHVHKIQQLDPDRYSRQRRRKQRREREKEKKRNEEIINAEDDDDDDDDGEIVIRISELDQIRNDNSCCNKLRKVCQRRRGRAFRRATQLISYHSSDSHSNNNPPNRRPSPDYHSKMHKSIHQLSMIHDMAFHRKYLSSIQAQTLLLKFQLFRTVMISYILPIWGVILLGLTISWNSMEDGIVNSDMVLVLQIGTIIYQGMFVFKALLSSDVWSCCCCWPKDSNNFIDDLIILTYIDWILILVSAFFDWYWFIRDLWGTFELDNIIYYVVIISYMTVRMWHMVVDGRDLQLGGRRNTTLVYDDIECGEEADGESHDNDHRRRRRDMMTIPKLRFIWTSQSISLLSQIVPEIILIWDSLCDSWGEDFARTFCDLSIYITEANNYHYHACNALLEEFGQSSLVRSSATGVNAGGNSAFKFKRPNFYRIIENHTLQCLHDNNKHQHYTANTNQQSNTLLTFCGVSSPLSSHLNNVKLSNDVNLVLLDLKHRHGMDSVSNRHYTHCDPQDDKRQILTTTRTRQQRKKQQQHQQEPSWRSWIEKRFMKKLINNRNGGVVADEDENSRSSHRSTILNRTQPMNNASTSRHLLTFPWGKDDFYGPVMDLGPMADDIDWSDGSV